jgi:hypothetical protein
MATAHKISDTTSAISRSCCALRASQCIGMALLLAFLLPVPLTFAVPRQPLLRKNKRANVELGFGVPYARILKGIVRNFEHGVNVGSNGRVGVVWGYGLTIGPGLGLGPEVGLSYGMIQKTELPGFDGAVEERYLQIPVGMRIYLPTQWGIIRESIGLGYELDILLASWFRQSGNEASSSVRQMGDKPLKDMIPGLRRMSGGILIDSTIDLPKGFYAMVRIKLPVADFIYFLKEQPSSRFSAVRAAKVLSTSLLEFGAGVNIAKWF